MRALVCSTRMPEYDRECGSKRVFDLLLCLREAGWSITYVAQQADPHDRHATQLRRSGIPTYVGLDTLSEEFLTESRFDLALLAFWHVAEQCLPPLRRFSPHTRVVIDSIDLHFLRNTRGMFQKARAAPAAASPGDQFGGEFVRELSTYAAADAVLAVSEKETGLIADLLADPDAAAWVPLCEELPPSTAPFAERRGLLFVGNFWHQPNVDAAAYLVEEILPKLDPRLLEAHPLWIVGNASADHAARFRGRAGVHVVGWVPSLLPYLSRVRVTTAPLRFGAGIKGKLVQSLMTGTPVVATTLGAEGLGLTHGRDLLVADDAGSFAAGLERLLTDEQLWGALAGHGVRTLTAIHGRQAVNARFLAAIDQVLRRPAKAPSLALPAAETAYEEVCARMKAAIEATVPLDAAVAVISKGDPEMVTLAGRRGEHFPRLDDGRYAGAYPADSVAAVAELDRVHAQGAQFLVVPSTAAWWLEYYKEFATFLDAHAELIWHDEICRIYRLAAAAHAAAPPRPSPRPARVEAPSIGETDLWSPGLEMKKRPVVDPAIAIPASTGPASRVLAAGIYLLGQPNCAADEMDVLRRTEAWEVEQRWVALGGEPPPELAGVTVRTVLERTPKFQLLNDLLAGTDLSTYEYVVVLDDDVILPHGFLDALLAVQRECGFALAQPARTSDSYFDHPIVEQQRGVRARRTGFVEIGPVFSVHRSAFDVIFPFDVTSSMGWGYENVWSHRLHERGLRMGIVDAVPLAHSIRKPVVNYQWHVADAERRAFLARHPHRDLDDCFRVLEIIDFDEAVYA